MDNCKECGKPLWHDGKTTSLEVCTCQQQSVIVSQGWQCPICGAVMSPYTSGCVNCKGSHHIVSMDFDYMKTELKKKIEEDE